MIYDISPTISDRTKVWPGDTPVSREVLCDMGLGDNLTLSTLRSTVHLGAHADAPSHYGAEAASIEAVDLARYVGDCRVVHVDVGRGERVSVEMVGSVKDVSRVLIATGTYPDSAVFNEDFAALAPELVDHLHGCGVELIGIDTPSVDLFSSTKLPAHRRFLANGMGILEGLVLGDVADGVYELIALPLKLAGFDASPVRAVLRTMD